MQRTQQFFSASMIFFVIIYTTTEKLSLSILLKYEHALAYWTNWKIYW